ncbi:MAG: NAD(P)/FAD-dependent oxidoreductase [Acidobacteria bacterium]|nr:NAD(P)/FAD-dependent oxidoreductase [Acidobacteriota bacterium]
MTEIVVVGAGLTGLTAALRLAQSGYRVRVFERYPRPGGLARVFEVGGERLEAFYHHLFTTDSAYVRLARELDLASAIEWLPSRMGIWTDHRLWDFGTPQSLLRFSPLSLVDKARFVLWTVLLQRSGRAERYADVTAKEWICAHQGRRVWDVVWGPLFHQKFSDYADQVAMVWLWRKVYLRGRSRSRSGLGERLGYMRGSFARLVETLAARITGLGGEVSLSDEVRRLEHDDAGFQVMSRQGEVHCDRVLLAIPIPEYLEVAGHLLPAADLDRLHGLKSTAAICTVLEMNRSLTPYYWLNIADPDMPFGGLIEHTNYISRERYGGRHILYISNYLLPNDPMLSLSKSEILDRYVPALQRINSSFGEDWIVASHHFKADYAQPLVTVGYRRLIPPFRTAVPGLYLGSMAQIYPEDRGQNYAVEYGEKVARCLIEDLGG